MNKAVIVYASLHHQNTYKLVKAVSERFDITLINATKQHCADLSVYDMIGFASGIDFGRFYPDVEQFLENNLPENKQVYHRVKLTFKPLVRVLGEHLSTSWLNGSRADDKLVGANNNRNIAKNMGERRASALDYGKILRRLIALGYENSARALDPWHSLVEGIYKLFYSCAFLNHEFYVFHIISKNCVFG